MSAPAARCPVALFAPARCHPLFGAWPVAEAEAVPVVQDARIRM
jgi:hypothetical protein